MNLAKTKILLDKINRLYKSMSLDEDNVAPIEKDLMRDYVKQLYETFLDNEERSVPVTPRRTTTPKTTYTPPAVVRKKVIAPPPAVVETIPVVRRTPPPPPVVEEVPVVRITPPPPPPPVVEAKPIIAVPPPRPQKTAPSYAVDPEHADLFDVNVDSKELSEKLSQTRINDLNNAMGLNERIFTVNELFGADNSLYRNTIKDLNALPSFEEAKAYLSANVAEKFNWTTKNKRNKAKIFIKLVRRVGSWQLAVGSWQLAVKKFKNNSFGKEEKEKILRCLGRYRTGGL